MFWKSAVPSSETVSSRTGTFKTFRSYPVDVVYTDDDGHEQRQSGTLLERTADHVQINMRGRVKRIPRDSVIMSNSPAPQAELIAISAQILHFLLLRVRHGTRSSSGLTNLIDDISEEKETPSSGGGSGSEGSPTKDMSVTAARFIQEPAKTRLMRSTSATSMLPSTWKKRAKSRVLASKIIVEEVESEDHQIALAEVMQVAEDAQAGDTVVLDVTPEKEDFGRWQHTTKQVLAQKLRTVQRRMIQEEFAGFEDPVLTARVICFERQSVIMAVSSGLGRPEVEAELPRRDQLPNDNYRANATFKVFLKEVS